MLTFNPKNLIDSAFVLVALMAYFKTASLIISGNDCHTLNPYNFEPATFEASSNFKDPVFESKLKDISKTDENLKIRNAAMKTLEKTYDQVI